MRDFTTLRKLGKHRDQYFSAVVRWNDQVFFAAPAKNGGYLARIYEMVDLEDALSELDARLSLIAEPEERFKDSGHAIKWCFEHA